MKEKQIRKVTLSSEGLKGLIIEGTVETVKEATACSFLPLVSAAPRKKF